MLRSTCLLGAYIVGTTLHAQIAPSIEWQRSFGGSVSDTPLDIEPTADGGYIVCGWTDSDDGDVTGHHGMYDMWVLKLDQQGNLEWQRALGGSDQDAARSVQQTADGGYVVAGYSRSSDGDLIGNQGITDLWVVKLDAQGSLVWQRTYGGSGDDVAYSVRQMSSGEYMVAGWSNSTNGDVTTSHGGNEVWVLKLDAIGDLLWQKTIGGSGDESAEGMLLTSDGGSIVVGLTSSNNGDVSGNHGSTDCWVVKLDAAGGIQWQSALGGNLGEAGYEVIENSDGSFVVSGHAASNTGDVFGNHGQIDGWVLKLDANGALLWQNALGGSEWDVSHALLSTADGGYLIAGGSASSDGDITGEHGLHDAWLVQLDAAGDLIWQVPFGGSSYEGAQSIAPASDGGYVFAANSASTDGDVLGNQGSGDFWIVKLTDPATAIRESALKPLSIAPNPAAGHCTVSLADAAHSDALLLRDPQGSTLLRVPTFGRERIHVPLTDLAPGTYIMSTIGEERTGHARLVVTY